MTNHPNRSKGPMFGRRHWDAMSSIMRRNYIGSDLRQWTRIRDDTAAMFEEDNEAFDRAKFVEACSPAKVNCPQCRGIGYFGHPHDGDVLQSVQGVRSTGLGYRPDGARFIIGRRLTVWPIPI